MASLKEKIGAEKENIEQFHLSTPGSERSDAFSDITQVDIVNTSPKCCQRQHLFPSNLTIACPNVATQGLLSWRPSPVSLAF